MPKSKAVGMAQTVLGPVSPQSLGKTSTHEHLLIDFVCMFREPKVASEIKLAYEPVDLTNLGWVRYDPFRNLDNLRLVDEQTIINEVGLFKRAGGGTIIDATTIGIGRDPLGLARISRATSVNVVMGAGYYVDAVHPDTMDEKSVDMLADQIIEELTFGVEDTGIKAGIIGEIGCTWPLTANEKKVLIASSMAQKETGASILIHPGRNESAPLEILDLISGSGGDLNRVVMGHLDRTIHDLKKVVELAESGCYLEYDLFGWETSFYPFSDLDMPNDGQRINWVKNLVNMGYSGQVVLAQDIWGKHFLSRYGGYGYAHILNNIVPRMNESGISNKDLNKMLVGNPANILTIV